jgi:hypothetical protein
MEFRGRLNWRRCGNCLFYSRFREEFKVTIDGEIKNPGTLIILKD